jgi:2-phosphoglycolate phosphatase
MNTLKNIQAVFFDLDGTLLDTAPDLVAACNQVLQEYQKPPISLNEFKYYIHGGAMMMICESFGVSPHHPDYPKIKSQFLKHYQSQIIQNTCLYPGIENTLQLLEKQRIPWGVITNKLEYLTKPIMDHFGFSQRCCCIICGDTLPTPKPHPAPLLHACQLIKVQPQNSVFVGDSLIDMQAATAAGMTSVAAAYGYLPKDSQLSSWPCDVSVHTPYDLVCLFEKWLRPS